MSEVSSPKLSDIIELDSDTWKIEHNFSTNLNKKLRLRSADSTCVFNVQARLSLGANYSVLLTVYPEADKLVSHISYAIDYKAQLKGFKEEGKLTKDQVTSPPLTFGGQLSAYYLTVTFEFEFTKVDIGSISGLFCPLEADLKSYIDRGPTVRLVGNDGNVLVPKRILKLRSKALEAMFGHDSKENQTGEIKLEDFGSKTLESFAHFLMTGEIIDGKDTALGLILLGDKYDIQAMKSAAENFVKRNIAQMDEDEVIEIFYRVGRKSLYGAMVDSWARE